MIYFAHRGAWKGDVIANTLPAFALARAQGATYYELDVHLLKDGQLAVHHDYALLSGAAAGVPLSSLRAADLTHYPLRSTVGQAPVFVPTLPQVLPQMIPHLQCLNIEIKNDDNVYPGIEKILWGLLRQFPALENKILFSSFDYPTLQRLRQLAPQARIGWLTRCFEVSCAQQLGVYSVHINQTRVSKELVEKCHQNGWKVFVYTVNDPAQAQHLAQLGVDGIFTDWPALFL